MDWKQLLPFVLFVLVLVSTGCPKDDDTGTIIDEIVDVDGDGYAASVDCNDHDAAIYPEAAEACNGLDDDCDGDVDEGVASEFFMDADSDGYGDIGVIANACDAPSGYVSDATDCNDADDTIHPGATETCNGLDDDCDGDVDEDTTGETTWYYDADGDGYGDPANSTVACVAPEAFVADATDCDDADSTIHPDAPEFCDGVDNDCDGDSDENAANAMPGYIDADGDGYGDADSPVVMVCDMNGYVDNTDDCDDANSGINPAASERCNGYDDNCDGNVDEDGSIGAGIYYADADNDSYGDPGSTRNSCEWPAGYVLNATDCDDTNSTVSPAATEACNGYDDDCDGTVDEDGATGGTNWYADADSDGYGTSLSGVTTSCSAPSGYVATNTDCDDSDPSINPGVSEYCDDIDNDCDGDVDESDALDAVAWYVDADADGYGNDSLSVTACTAGLEFVLIGGDCDDSDPVYNPGAVESDCSDPNDYNCDGATGYTDGDGDGFAACEECDDSDAFVYPGADEYCNGYDDNCDGTIDEDDALDAPTWYADADADDYGDPAVTDIACYQPTGYVADSADCDDSDGMVNPDGNEVCDGVDNDCDGTMDIGTLLGDAYYTDADNDGYGAETTVPTFSCWPLAGYADNNGDCDDTDGAINPAADEYCNGYDDDCDGSTDEDDAVDTSTWYADMDSDGYGDATVSTVTCYQPTGYVADKTDCDDTDASTYPGAGEYCDGVDHDCDGRVNEDSSVDAATWYMDADTDGYGDLTVSDVACTAPTSFVADSTDCDDDESSINPGADEVCDEVDNDCDGTTDEDDAVDASTWYEDADADGYGGTTSFTACDPSSSTYSSYSAVDGDCDDTDPAYHPGASENRGCSDLNDYNCDGSVGTDDLDGDGYMACLECDDSDASINPAADEYCDGVDNNCDGTVDEGTALDATVWYPDLDGDSYGDSLATSLETTVACVAPAAHAASNTDCDDSDSATYPGATEICDDLDNDCDGTADEGLGGDTWYLDADADGYGDPTVTTYDCGGATPSGYVADDSDCNDSDASVNPAAEEVCDGVDNDCDGTTDYITESDLVVGDLVITEFIGGSTGWIEIWNGSNCDVDIDGLNISTNSGSYTATSMDLLADEYLVFGASSTSYVDTVTGLTCSHNYDIIKVLRSDATVIDQVEHWNDVHGWPHAAMANSFSLDPGAFTASGNDNANNWCEAATLLPDGSGYGTPGADNDNCY